MKTNCPQCNKMYHEPKVKDGLRAFFCSEKCYKEHLHIMRKWELRRKEMEQNHFDGLSDSEKMIFLLQKICRKMRINTPS